MNRLISAQPEALASLPLMPDNLLEWVGNDTFVALVLSALEASHLPASHCRKDTFVDRMTSALLIYSYGRGIYGSYDIASMAANDRQVLSLLEVEPPDWHWLRRFRRDHYASVRQGLVNLLHAAWRRKPHDDDDSRSAKTERGFGCRPSLPTRSSQPNFELEADCRLQQAMLYDSMALDE